MDDGESPIVKLTYAILLSALNKRATAIAIHRVDGKSVVDFTIAEQVQEELTPPLRLHAPIIRRLAVMASLPVLKKGQRVTGTIKIRIGETREADFEIMVEGHGDDVDAHLQVVASND